MVLVTGGAGFIGARLVQQLARNHHMPLHALVHRLGTPGAARVAAVAGVRLIHGDVTDRAVVEEAARGCEVIFHCAVDTRSAPDVQERVTMEGAASVLSAARVHQARRIVHVSTAAVHSWSEPGVWNEEAPVRPNDVYSRSKRAAEELLLGNGDIPVTVVRPTCVYGPFSRTWTESPIEFMRFGIPLVSEENRERANLIYIDNLVDLLIAAANAHDRDHHVYLATEDQPQDWATLFSAYGRALGLPLLRYREASSNWAMWQEELAVSLTNAWLLAGRLISNARRPVLQDLITLQRHVPLLQRVRRFIPAGTIRAVSAAARNRPSNAATIDVPARTTNAGTEVDGIRPFAPAMIRRQYGAHATFTADRARRELGWTPRVSAVDAIERTCAWVAFAGL